MGTTDKTAKGKGITKVQDEIANMLLRYKSHIDNFGISYKDNTLCVEISKNRETFNERYADHRLFEFAYLKGSAYKYTIESRTGVYGHSNKYGYGYGSWYANNDDYIVKEKDIVETIETYIREQLIMYMQW